MSPQELLSAVRQRPFIPFRLHVSDGTVYAINHPEMLLVGLASCTVAVPAQAGTPIYEHTEIVAMRHIVRMVPIEQPAEQQG